MPKTLYFKFSLITILSVLGIMAIQVIVGYRLRLHNYNQELLHTTEQTIGRLEKNIGDFIEVYAVFDYENLIEREMVNADFAAIIIDDQNIAHSFGEQHYIKGKIRNNTNSVIDYDPNRLQHRNILQESTYQSERIIQKNGKLIGKLEIYSTNQRHAKALEEFVKVSVIQTFIVCIFLNLILLVFIRKLLTNPIRELVEAARSVESGDYKVMASVGSKDEVSELATTFNSMTKELKKTLDNLEKQIEERTQAEKALSLVAGGGHLFSKDIFPFLVRQISVFTKMRYALIARITRHDSSNAYTISVWSGDHIADNFSYTLEGTPCKNVVDDGICFYSSNVTTLFPKDRLLVEMDAEAYWGVPLLNSKGDAIGVLAVLHDKPIVESSLSLKILKTFAIRAATELERMEGEDQFRNLFENNPVSCWLEDFSGVRRYFDTLIEDGISDIEAYFREHPESIKICVQNVKVLDVNQATLGLHQAESKEQLLQGLEKTFTPASLAVFQKEMIDIWNGKKQATYDSVVRTFNDELRYVTVSYKVAPGHEELLDKVLVTLIDITEKTLAEKKQNELEIQLQQSQKLEAIGTLAGGIAHDFNNILAAILGYAEMARDDSPPESIVAKDLDKVLEGGNRAKDLVQQILAFSRQNEMEKIPLQPVSVVKEAVKMLRPSLPTTIEIRQDIPSSTRHILADPTQIHQILMNLCTNAFHAMEETGGKLDISLKEVTLSIEDLVREPNIEPGAFIQLSVCDSGPGMTPDIKAKIFDPYFTTKGTGKGTGMGLAIVHGIVKSYEGFISLYSKLGEGTAFHVFLPAIEKEALPETEAAEPIPVGRDRILFIDDEEILAEMGKSMLERLGYQVTVRNDSIEALETFKNQPDLFDLVITDQTMPGMTGADIARRMIQIRPDIPIILCTGYSTVISEEKAKSFGIKEFALKPLSKKDIAVLIRKVLDNP